MNNRVVEYKDVVAIIDMGYDLHPKVPRYKTITFDSDYLDQKHLIRVVGPEGHSYAFTWAFPCNISTYTASEFCCDLFTKVMMSLDRIEGEYIARYPTADLVVKAGSPSPVVTAGRYNDNDVPGTITSKSLSDIYKDIADSLCYAGDMLFRPTSWGTARSVHKAEAVEAAYTSGPVTTLIFRNGDKVQVRKSENDLLNAEKGLAMCVCKAILDKDDYETLCKYAGKGAVITLAKFLMSPPEYAKLKNDIWKRFE